MIFLYGWSGKQFLVAVMGSAKATAAKIPLLLLASPRAVWEMLGAIWAECLCWMVPGASSSKVAHRMDVSWSLQAGGRGGSWRRGALVQDAQVCAMGWPSRAGVILAWESVETPITRARRHAQLREKQPAGGRHCFISEKYWAEKGRRQRGVGGIQPPTLLFVCLLTIGIYSKVWPLPAATRFYMR